MDNIILKKKEIRKEIASLKKQISFDKKVELSESILCKLESLPSFKNASNILLYYSLEDEVQTESFIRKWCKSKNIFLPVVKGDILVIKQYDKDNIKKGSYSINEPTGGIEVSPEQIELVVVPGVAFDKDCNRLGRGKGYYDKLLPAIKAPAIGIAFDFQITNSIPTEETDIPLNGIITETDLILKF
ncbi:MAG: 5-formyltetrahydrofolate cyclo-ligase [Bacteroidales bacterium]|nr:5-formyltetrahydrofolate cyclo-ligase [Bacteroidales bacterium]